VLGAVKPRILRGVHRNVVSAEICGAAKAAFATRYQADVSVTAAEAKQRQLIVSLYVGGFGLVSLDNHTRYS
jgi:hypothetical protein